MVALKFDPHGAQMVGIIAKKFHNPFRDLAGPPAKVSRTRPTCAWRKAAHYSG